MFRRPLIPLALALVLSTAAARAQKGQVESVDLVEIDVVVVDKAGQPVRGLSREDFSVKDDGHAVQLTTFAEVSATDPDTRQPRTLVLMLDDVAAPATATEAIRVISRGVLGLAHDDDEIAVVRLSRHGEEAFGDRRLAEERIGSFRSGASPFLGYLTQRDTLDRVAATAQQMESRGDSRKVLLCIGSPIVCNVDEPLKSTPFNLWDSWVSAIGSAARAKVAVYAVIPGRAVFRRGGLVEHTGGELFPATYDVLPALQRILRDAENYYVLGYWPTGKPKAARSLDVKVNRRGTEVHARRRR